MITQVIVLQLRLITPICLESFQSWAEEVQQSTMGSTQKVSCTQQFQRVQEDLYPPYPPTLKAFLDNEITSAPVFFWEGDYLQSQSVRLMSPRLPI